MISTDKLQHFNADEYMVHAKASGYAFAGPKCQHHDTCIAQQRCITFGECEHPNNPSARFFDLSQAQALNRLPQVQQVAWPWPTSESMTKPEAGELRGFDSDAHRRFMRSLG